MFAENLKKLRKKNNITQEELAKSIGVSKSTIAMYEGNNRLPRADTTLYKIADYFGVSIDNLLGFDNIDKENPESQTELEEYLEYLRTRPEMKMLFSLTKGASKEDVEKAVKIIETLLGKDERNE